MDVRQEWQQLADDLGFAFKPGVDALLESNALRMMGEALGRKNMGDPSQMERARSMLENPMVRSVLNKVIMGVVTGEYRGFEFMLMRGSRSGGGSGNSTSYRVNIGLLFKDPLTLNLRVVRRTLFTGLFRMFNKKRLVRFPEDAELGKLITATSDDPLEAEAYLRSSSVRGELKELFRMRGEFTITDHGVRMHRPGQTIARDEALPYMDAMVRVAESL